ncbi:MAG: hypothetical protein JWM68_2105 [Verrucomicrobiales bacterium]|nr:hypothetical protein [Verrucomicrobiales bacterium]
MKPEKKSSAPKSKIGKPTPTPKPTKISKPAAKPAAKTKVTKKTLSARVESAVKKVGAVAKKVKSATKKLTPVAKEVAGKIEKAVKKTTRAAAEKRGIKIPSILLEGDAPSTPSTPAPSGPGQRYSLGPTPPVEHLQSEGELPEAYGTKELLLTARDPHWLYAHWDLKNEQLRKFNALSVDGHLVLRVFKNQIAGSPHNETHVHPESRNWFVHVGQGATKYMAELGYYDKSRNWVSISTSRATFTPPDALSEDISVRFATIPTDMPFEELIKLVKAAVSENVPLAEAILQLRAEGFKNLPTPEQIASLQWTPAQEKALGSLITMDSVRRLWIGSLEITELIRRQLAEQISSIGAAQLERPSSLSVTSLASPFGGMEKRKGFWFNVNAELIIYGATEHDASVTIGGREIKLRPDGTFSFRFILPDGDFHLPAIATSADGDDSRAADLKFRRKTEYRGDVGAHPQDPKMKPPVVEAVA